VNTITIGIVEATYDGEPFIVPAEAVNCAVVFGIEFARAKQREAMKTFSADNPSPCPSDWEFFALWFDGSALPDYAFGPTPEDAFPWSKCDHGETFVGVFRVSLVAAEKTDFVPGAK
jgi:hypothetical protein